MNKDELKIDAIIINALESTINGLDIDEDMKSYYQSKLLELRTSVAEEMFDECEFDNPRQCGIYIDHLRRELKNQ